MTESFKGCIQDFFLNGKPVDVINSLKVMGVRHCFLNTEPGVHFDSFGFAVYGLCTFKCISSDSLLFKLRAKRIRI